MDSSALDLSCPPVERAMTVSAPHLTAPISLVDDVPTLRAAFRISPYQLDRLHGVGVTDVTLGLGFVTLFAKIRFADSAVIVLREKPFTIRCRTFADEFPGFDVGAANFVSQSFEIGVDDLHGLVDGEQFGVADHRLPRPLKFRVYLYESLFLTPQNRTQLTHLNDTLDVGLCSWHEKFLTLEEDVFAVFLQVGIPEFFGTETVDELTVPPHLAVHAVRVFICREQIRLTTFLARVVVTKETRDFFVTPFVEILATHRTRSIHPKLKREPPL